MGSLEWSEYPKVETADCQNEELVPHRTRLLDGR